MVSTTTCRLWSDVRSSWCEYDIVGESYYIGNIQRLFPHSWNRDGEELFRDVELVPEPDNPYDERAISVRVDGCVLGHLQREDAPAWAGVIRRITASGLTAITNSRIYLYEAPDWENPDRHGNPRTETRARVSIKLGNPELALPLNDPPAVPYTLVPRSSIVQVTKENDHFDALFDYVPPSGRGLLYVTLHEDTVTSARTAKALIEVRVDNKRIGQLTPQMSQRFLPMIQHLKARGLVTACWGDITGSSIAAEVRIDAVKANEADDTVLDGPAVTEPALIAAQGDPRRYRIPDAYDGPGDTSRRQTVTTADGQRQPRVTDDAEPEAATADDVEVVAHATSYAPDRPAANQISTARKIDSPALLITVLIVGGFFSVLIPHVGPIIWLASWSAAIYLTVKWVRRAAKARHSGRHRQ